MNDASDVNKDLQAKREWVTPELSSMSVEQTLSGIRNNRSETMSGRSNPPGS